MMSITSCTSGEGGDAENMAGLFGPQQIDQFIRQAVQFCWMSLPKEPSNAGRTGEADPPPRRPGL